MRCVICNSEFKKIGNRKFCCCDDCSKIHNKNKNKINKQKYYKNNKKYFDSKNKQYYQNNKENILRHQKQYYEEYKENRLEYWKKYGQEHKEDIKNINNNIKKL
jgi:hypothetical protein